VWIAPVLPGQLGTIYVDNLRLGGSEVRIAASDHHARLFGLPPEFEVVHGARPPVSAWVETG
jgi:hypothetical protein